MAKVLVSIDDELLRRIDERAASLGLTRSAFVASLATEELDGRSQDEQARRRTSLARIRALVAASATGGDDEDTTAFIRRMRDER